MVWITKKLNNEILIGQKIKIRIKTIREIIIWKILEKLIRKIKQGILSKTKSNIKQSLS